MSLVILLSYAKNLIYQKSMSCTACHRHTKRGRFFYQICERTGYAIFPEELALRAGCFCNCSELDSLSGSGYKIRTMRATSHCERSNQRQQLCCHATHAPLCKHSLLFFWRHTTAFSLLGSALVDVNAMLSVEIISQTRDRI